MPHQGIHTDCIIIENSTVKTDWQISNTRLVKHAPAPAQMPQGVVPRVHSGEAFDQVKLAKDLACVDIVIVTRMPDGQHAVLLSKRKASDPFGGLWWIHGGSLGSYMDVGEFIAERAQKECGVPVTPQVLIGVYRTSASNFPQSTLQPCYATVVPYEVIQKKMDTDGNHESVKLFTWKDLDAIDPAEAHWYPLRVANIALQHMPI